MKYYNVELSRTRAEKLQQLLYNIGVSFEISAAGPWYHFEILLNPNGPEKKTVETFLYSGAIEEVRSCI